MKFSHVILTQFNVKTNHAFSEKRLSPEWLEPRFELFEKFSYPAVYGQSNQNFKWIVYFDSQTPQPFKDRIKKYAAWKNFIPVYLDDVLTQETNKQAILESFSECSAYLITTRLDNDDALCKSYTEMVQRNFASQDFEFISFANGHVLHVDGRLYSLNYLNNPFVSLIEKINSPNTSGFRTVLCGVPHTELSKVGSMKKVKSDVSWLQVIHSSNVSNRVRGVRVPKKALDGKYTIDLSKIIQDEDFATYTIDYARSVAHTIAREFAINLRNIVQFR